MCLLQKEKLLPFLSYIEDLIKNEIFQFFDMNGFYDFMITKILEMKLVEHLQLLLDHFAISGRKLARSRDEKHTFFKDHLKINSKYLLTACDQDSLGMVKVFIKHNCYLSITAGIEQNLDWISVPNPFGGKIVPERDSRVLHILRMMSTKAYILGCYQAMIETKGIKDCQCLAFHVVTRPRGFEEDTWRSESIFFQDTIAKISKPKMIHECPASEDFMPNFMDCVDHVECNDPISR